jgi:hypothetical protein
MNPLTMRSDASTAAVTNAVGLRKVLETIAPALRAAHRAGSFAPSSYATPLTVSAYALEHEHQLVVTATSAEAEL